MTKTLAPTAQYVTELEARLKEAEDTLEAIRLGAVDALVVKSRNEQEIFTLRSADYTYRMLIESMNQAALTVNYDGTLLYSNKQFSMMLGQPLDKVIGQCFLDFISQADRPLIQSLLDGTQGNEATLELGLQTKHNSQLTVIASAAILSQTDVKPYWCIVLTDLTERKQAEDAKDEFISLASHQLRTPATSVKQYVNMVLDGLFGDINPTQRDALQRANASNERELKIIEDLLKVAQLDAGKVILNRSQIDLAALIDEVVQEQQSKIADRQQRVVYRIPRRPLYAEVDEILMRMVIENLLDNASKYMSEGGTIRITASRRKARAKFTVADEGVGMSQQDLTKLFQKFSRLPNRLSVKVGGNGLGLYWVKKVIDLHGADIQVTSQVGTGTKFCVSLPEAKTATEGDEAHAAHSGR